MLHPDIRQAKKSAISLTFPGCWNSTDVTVWSFSFTRRRHLMPRYFFHTYDGDIWIHDIEGEEFSDLGAAVQEAANVARDLLKDPERTNDADFRIEVADENGTVLHVLRFSDVYIQ
jgi:hypothetical protein